MGLTKAAAPPSLSPTPNPPVVVTGTSWGMWGAFGGFHLCRCWLGVGAVEAGTGVDGPMRRERFSFSARWGGPNLLAMTKGVPDSVSTLAGLTALREEKAPRENREARVYVRGRESQSQSIYCWLGQ